MRYIIHEGYLLKLYAEAEKGRIAQLVKVLGITRNNIYFQYGKETLDKNYVDKLREKSIVIPGLTSKEDDSMHVMVVGEPAEHYGRMGSENGLRKELKHKDELIKSQRETIAALQQALKKSS